MKTIFRCFLIFVLIFLVFDISALNVGIGKTDITPPIGTPSAGFADRKGEGMTGIHDPLSAIALYIDNGEKQIVLCSVDNLGFTYEMVQEIIRKAHSNPELAHAEIYIGSSHTHSGGGAFLNIPKVGQYLAGQYDPNVRDFYIDKTVEAIAEASQNLIPAKIGIGYGQAEGLSKYRASWPKNVEPLVDVAVIKVTGIDDSPVAVLFNFPVHPTILSGSNQTFSADFVGYARDRLQYLLGSEVQAIYFNGAQGDIAPVIFNEQDRFASCQFLGKNLGDVVEKIWQETEASDSFDIKTQKSNYSFQPLATPFGLQLPLEKYDSEMNLLVFNNRHAFVTIPGELSTVYDRELKEAGRYLGYDRISVFGLTNDAHGYIISPESWQRKTNESALSFGGENYGEQTKNRALDLLKAHAPNQ